MPPVADKKQPTIIIVRKKKGHGGHHGGAWKVAFADFMTAMFAMFLVLWLINQSSDVKSAIAGYFQDPLGRADEFGSSIIPGEGAQAQVSRKTLSVADVTNARKDKLQSTAKDIQQKMASSPELKGLDGHVSISMTDEGLQIELLEDEAGYFFQSGGADPSEQGKKILSLLGSELGTLSLPIRIDGHSDAHPYTSKKDYTNWELSADRANVARRIMVEHGLGGEQMVEVRAFADRHPRVGEDPYSATNRRVTITVMLNAMGESGAVVVTDSTEGENPSTVKVP